MAQTATLGYPRIGKSRELKRATEGYWAGRISSDDLLTEAAAVRKANWETQRGVGIDLIPCNDFSLYDQVLDTIALVGAVPERYHWNDELVDLDTYFAMARGAQREGLDATAMEMTKWFDTNYHYIVPEFEPNQRFRLASTKPFDEYDQARALGINPKPALLGPLSFLLLGKSRVDGFDPLELLDALLPVYRESIGRLSARGARWIQLDEPCFAMDRTDRERVALERAYSDLARHRGDAGLIVQTYFDHVGDSYDTLVNLPVQGIGFDFVRGPENLGFIASRGYPRDKVLGAGLVDGRNVWIADLQAALGLVDRLSAFVSPDRLIVCPSCSLLHVPYDVRLEVEIDPRLREWLAFGEQKLVEVVTLARAINEGPESVVSELQENQAALERRRRSDWLHRPDVKRRAAEASSEDASRATGYARRREAQRRHLNLPAYPTTVIGSFPQTAEVRRNRSRRQKGEIGPEEHDLFVEQEIRKLITFQEELGLDVLVHGEFERSDMVEYFAERLEGCTVTRRAWVQSYGTRYVRPPIISGDVFRPAPMTVRWSEFAQSLTAKPVKGMLTGPVTILNWSFVRDDQPRSETCKQIALAIRDEVRDLARAGIRVIQVDEPALREGLPLHRGDWLEYLDWATYCFRLATSVAEPATQIHSHMCYSHFDDIIEAIAALDADVISMSNSRSDLELLETFRHVKYANEIGPGVYDIHSPRIPSREEIRRNLEAASAVLDREQLWVNPDCGLKTRQWREVIPALQNMVQAAEDLRRAAEGP